MTGRQVIEAIQNLGEENLDLQVYHYDDYKYVPSEKVSLKKDKDWKDKEYSFIALE